MAQEGIKMMSKVGFWATAALALTIGEPAAHAQTPMPLSSKDFVMAASQSDQYEVLAANIAVGAKPGFTRHYICSGHDPGSRPDEPRPASGGYGFRLAVA